jgi:hypothetical protein
MLSPPQLRAGLTELARLPTTAAIAFQIANARAQGNWSEQQTANYASFVRADPYETLRASDNSVLESRATLVIAPASILGQWRDEQVPDTPRAHPQVTFLSI